MAQKREVSLAKRNVARLDAYKTVFSGPAGEAVLYDLMSNHHVLSSTFDGNVRNTIFKEGERNVVLRILKVLNMDVAAIKERIKQNESAIIDE